MIGFGLPGMAVRNRIAVDYWTRVSNAAERRDGKPLLNTSLDHAAIVVEHMFRDAYKRVDILSRNLNPTVHGRICVIRPADEFLQKPGRDLRILLENDDKHRRDDDSIL